MSEPFFAACDNVPSGEFDDLIKCHLRPSFRSMDVVRLADKYRSAGVVGIDIAGDEHNYPIAPHVPAFQRALQLGIHRTVHAGETGSANSVREAIELCHAERIGHGYAVIDDPAVYAQIREKDIHLECCLTSSIQTNAIGKYVPSDSEREQSHLVLHGQKMKTRLHSHIKSKRETWHPIHHFARDNLNFSLSCDDPSVCQITIEHEYEHALADLKLTPAQLTRCVFNAARSTFLNEKEKHLLVRRLMSNYIPGAIIDDHCLERNGSAHP